ncbi:hypothetical protein HDZ31DRAFT_41802 [Schizophyllum fasciatum]
MAATCASTAFLSLDISFSPLLADTPTQTLPFLRELQALLGDDAEAQLARTDSASSRARSPATPAHPPSTSSAPQCPTPAHREAQSSLSRAPSPLTARKRLPYTPPSAVPALLVTDADEKPRLRSLDSVPPALSTNSSALARDNLSLQVPSARPSAPSSGSRRTRKPATPSVNPYATPKEIIALLTLLEEADNDVEEDVARVRENIKEVRETLDDVRAKRKARKAKLAAGKENIPPKITLTAVSSDFWLS